MTNPKYQDWKLVNLDRCCSHEQLRGYKQFLDFIFHDHKWLVLLLARPVFRSQAPKVCLPPPDTSRRDLGRLSLPPEIINLVFGHIEELKDIVALAVSHRLLSVIGWRRLIQVRRAQLAEHSWCDNRIITLGELVNDLEDLPEGAEPRRMRDVLHLPEHGRRKYPSPSDIQDMLNEVRNDLAEIRAERPLMDGDTDDEDFDITDLNHELGFFEFEGDDAEEGFFWFTSKYYPDISQASSERRGGSDYHFDTSSPRIKLDCCRADMFYASTAPYYPAACEWALCNSTRKEYVLASVIAKIPRWQYNCDTRGPFIVDGAYCEKIFDLGALALLLTAWSTDMGSICDKGLWAGERLSILRIEDIGDGERAGWVDVSKEMHKRVEQWMWRHQEHLELNMAI
ncbi:unnamed protein product [Peniophora sp. CBMAI 1063]|nr:unnamed protein product [Peniophora sp. CBMAI 1063]